MNELLQRVRMVLSRPAHPGNVGSAARAMKTMGLSDLRIVGAVRHRDAAARAMAVGAADLLDAARVHESIAEATADCTIAFALSARQREWSPPVLAVREAALEALAHAAHGPVAFVFGTETAGLSNEEVFKCRFLVRIPTSDTFSSLNLGQAVQIVAYELCMAAGGVVQTRKEFPATVADLEGLYAHLEQAAVESGFYNPLEPTRLPERLRRLFSRVALEREEANILRGLLYALQRRRDDRGKG